MIKERFAKRGRALEIARLSDLEAMQNLMEDWLNTVKDTPILTLDSSTTDIREDQVVKKVLDMLY